jgi:hypothetical protein
MRRVAILFLAVAAVGQTGCHGRVRSFFYRLFHCDHCSPAYGAYGSAPVVSGPVYGGGAACCSNPAPIVHAAPVSYTVPGPTGGHVFGPSTPLPSPQVQPGTSIPAPMSSGEKK